MLLPSKMSMIKIPLVNSVMKLPSLVTNFSILVTLVLISSRSIGDSMVFTGDGCQGLLVKFANVTANFTMCTIENARPIKVCQLCVHSYMDVLQEYQNILKLHDEGGTPCKLQLINVDRLEVVEASYKFVINQWNRADCNYCFQNESGSITPTENEYTKGILQKYRWLMACFTNNSNKTDTNSTINPQICTNCAQDYHDLNEYYNINRSFVHGFCMDIVDMINTTRNAWSQDFGCCAERERTETVFLIASFAFCFIPLVFYSLVRLCSARHLLSISTPKRWEQYLSSGSSTSNLIQS